MIKEYPAELVIPLKMLKSLYKIYNGFHLILNPMTNALIYNIRF